MLLFAWPYEQNYSVDNGNNGQYFTFFVCFARVFILVIVPDMRVEIATLSKGLFAEMATKRLLISVKSNVIVQVARLGKSLVAIRTSKWFFTWRKVLVNVDRQKTGKPTCMNPDMVDQITALRKGFIADHAHVGFVASVRSHVNLQITEKLSFTNQILDVQLVCDLPVVIEGLFANLAYQSRALLLVLQHLVFHEMCLHALEKLLAKGAFCQGATFALCMDLCCFQGFVFRHQSHRCSTCDFVNFFTSGWVIFKAISEWFDLESRRLFSIYRKNRNLWFQSRGGVIVGGFRQITPRILGPITLKLILQQGL